MRRMKNTYTYGTCFLMLSWPCCPKENYFKFWRRYGYYICIYKYLSPAYRPPGRSICRQKKVEISGKSGEQTANGQRIRSSPSHFEGKKLGRLLPNLVTLL